MTVEARVPSIQEVEEMAQSFLPVLAGGGIVLGWASRHDPRARWTAWTAVAA